MNSRRSKRLRYAFGLPGYWLQPSMLNNSSKINCLESLPLQLGRGFPMIMTSGIDSLLNMHYYQIGGEVMMPPIALALNDPKHPSQEQDQIISVKETFNGSA